MADIRRRAQQLSIIAAVIALHIAACWFLLATKHLLGMQAISQRIQLVYIPPPIIPSEANAGSSAREHRSRRSLQQSRAAPPVDPRDAAPSSEERSAIHPPIDWAAELDRAARDSVPAEPAQEPRDFGFPHGATAPSSKSPEFAWSHARTHRVEAIPGGGLLVNLNDRCVIVFIPFPFPFCGVGKKPANGDLFEHMPDASPPGDRNAPK